MTPHDFCKWLEGFLDACTDYPLTQKHTTLIREKLKQTNGGLVSSHWFRDHPGLIDSVVTPFGGDLKYGTIKASTSGGGFLRNNTGGY